MIPVVGSKVRPVGSEIVYQVVSALENGCLVEAISSEVVDADGRQARPLHYSEKRFLLAICRNTGKLFDAGWRGWEVVA